MSYEEVIESTLKQFNLPTLKFESSFKDEVLVPSIETIYQENEIDIKLVEELEQLAKVYAVFFPDSPLQIGQTKVSEFLAQLRSEIGEI